MVANTVSRLERHSHPSAQAVMLADRGVDSSGGGRKVMWPRPAAIPPAPDTRAPEVLTHLKRSRVGRSGDTATLDPSGGTARQGVSVFCAAVLCVCTSASSLGMGATEDAPGEWS